jgi:hypothetical protein
MALAAAMFGRDGVPAVVAGGRGGPLIRGALTVALAKRALARDVAAGLVPAAKTPERAAGDDRPVPRRTQPRREGAADRGGHDGLASAQRAPGVRRARSGVRRGPRVAAPTGDQAGADRSTAGDGSGPHGGLEPRPRSGGSQLRRLPGRLHHGFLCAAPDIKPRPRGTQHRGTPWRSPCAGPPRVDVDDSAARLDAALPR